jgi:hypothetical protein
MKPKIISINYPDPRCPKLNGCNCGGPRTDIPEEYLYEEDIKRIKEWKETKKQREIEKKQKLEQVKNNPDPKYPWGCSPPHPAYREPQIDCRCAQPTYIRDKRYEKKEINNSKFAPGITPVFAPGITPVFAPGITPVFAPDITPVFAPGITPVYTPSITPRPEGLTENPALSFWTKYEYLILGGLALITIIIMIIMFKKFD